MASIVSVVFRFRRLEEFFMLNISLGSESVVGCDVNGFDVEVFSDDLTGFMMLSDVITLAR